MAKIQQSELVELFKKNGFEERDEKEQKDALGGVIPYVFYALRIREGRYQYISLVSYQGEFCEAVWEVFSTKKNTRMPKNKAMKREELEKLGCVAVTLALLRSKEQLEAIL